MTDQAAGVGPPKTPWHLWVVGILALLWFGGGAYAFFMAVTGRVPNMDPGEAAYYAEIAVWQTLLWSVNTIGGALAAIRLLFRNRLATSLFALSLVGVIVLNTAELATGDARWLVDRGALTVTLVVMAAGVLWTFYAFTMKKRGVLR
jgi:hypothetical protein